MQETRLEFCNPLYLFIIQDNSRSFTRRETGKLMDFHWTVQDRLTAVKPRLNRGEEWLKTVKTVKLDSVNP